MDEINGVLLDIDGVLVMSWEQIPGAAQTVGWLRARGIPFRLITNTTSHSRHELARTLRDAGVDVVGDDVVTAVVMTGSYLGSHHPGAKVFLLSDGDPTADLPEVQLVEDGADVVVIGGAFIVGLEEATGRKAVICGKPSPMFFHEAVRMVGTPLERTAMVGDDIANDVLSAQAVGLVGILVRTGKFMPTDLESPSNRPDHVIDSIADLPGLFRPS